MGRQAALSETLVSAAALPWYGLLRPCNGLTHLPPLPAGRRCSCPSCGGTSGGL